MWRPSSAQPPATWSGEDAAAQRERAQYARLHAAVDAAQGRPAMPFLQADAPAAAAAAVHRYVLQATTATDDGERFRTGKVLLPSPHVVAATAHSTSAAAADDDDDPASLLGGATAEFDLQRARDRNRGASASEGERSRRAALRAARARRGEAAAATVGLSRPSSSPHAGQFTTPQPQSRSHSAMLMRGQHMQQSPPPTAPATTLYGGINLFSPMTAPSFAASPRTPSSHHFSTPLAAPASVDAEAAHPARSPSPPLSPRMHSGLSSPRPTSRLMHLALSPCASPAESAALIRRLKQPVRLGIYEQRFEGKVEQVIGAKDQRAVEAAEARARAAAEAAMQLAAERAAKAVPGPYRREQEEAKQIADAELYYRVTTMQMQADRAQSQARTRTPQRATAHDPFTTPHAAPKPPSASRPVSGRCNSSNANRRHSAAAATPRSHTSSSPHAAAVRSGSVSARGAPLQTQMQLFRADLHAAQAQAQAQTPCAASTAAAAAATTVAISGPDSKAIRSVDLSAVAPAPSILTPASAASIVSPLTSASHWSNRVYTHGSVAGAATAASPGPQRVPAALVSPRTQATRAATALHAQQLAQKFHAFHRGVKEGLADPAGVAASRAATTAAAAGPDAGAHAVDAALSKTNAAAVAVGRSGASAPPSVSFSSSAPSAPQAQPLTRRARRSGESEEAFLASLSAELDGAFSELVTDAHYQSYTDSFQASLVQQRLDLLSADVAREGSVPGLHDQLHRMKAAWVTEAAKRAREERHERDVLLHRHWKTGRIVRDQTDEKEGGATEAAAAAASAASAAAGEGSPPGHEAESEEDRLAREHKHRLAEEYLSSSRAEAEEIERQRLELQDRDEHSRAARERARAASEALAAAALEVDYAEGTRQRPSDSVAAQVRASSNAGVLDASLRRVVATKAYLGQNLPDTVVVARAASIREEHMAAREVRAERRVRARQQKVDARALRRRRRDAGSDVETSSSGESDEDDADDGADSDADAERLEQFAAAAPALLAPVSSSSSAAAAAHHAEAVAALEPVTALLSLHMAHDRATAHLDATEASMRRQAREAERASAALRAARTVDAQAEGVAQHRRDLAGLLRLENNRRAIQTTHRKMKRTGTLELCLLGLLHSIHAASPGQNQASDIWSLVPRGHVARFEVRLVYASTDLPQLVAHTLPFSAPSPSSLSSSSSAARVGLTELLQRASFPIHNAHVQRVVVTLQAPSGKQLLHWLFHNRYVLLGPGAGLDRQHQHASTAGAGSGEEFDMAALAVGSRSSHSRPSVADYLRWCDPELTAVSARSAQSWAPSARATPAPDAEAHPPRHKLLHAGSSAAPSPRPASSSSTHMVPRTPHAGGRAGGARVGSAPLHGRKIPADAMPKPKGSFAQAGLEDQGEMASYRRSLAGWFGEGGPPAPATSAAAAAFADAPAPLSQAARVVHAHVTSATDTDTLGGWLHALRSKLAAARTAAPGAPDQDGSPTNNGQAGQRMQAIAHWSAEQVAMWLSGIGLEDASPLFHRRSIDGRALLAAANDVARIARRGEKRERAAREDESAAIAAMDMPDSAGADAGPDSSAGLVAKDGRPSTPEHVLQAGNKHRTAVAVHLTRALSLLTYARPVKISRHFPLAELAALRQRVLASFERVCALPAYVAAEEARREQLESDATTAELSAEQTAQLSLRLIAHNNREAKLLAARNAPRGRVPDPPPQQERPASATVASLAELAHKRSKAIVTKSLLHSQLQPMLPVSAAMAEAYRSRRGIVAAEHESARSEKEQRDGASGADDEDDCSDADSDEDEQDENARSHSLHPRRSIMSRESSPAARAQSCTPHAMATSSRQNGPITSAVAMFQSRPTTPTTPTATRVPSATAAVAATPRVQPVSDGVLLLGCFELSLRTIARAPDGVLRAAMVLRPGRVVASAQVHSAEASGAGLAGAVPLEAGPRSDAKPSSGRCSSAGAGSRAHYRSDMTTTMHSASPRTFLAASSVPSALPTTPQRAPSAVMPAVPTPATVLMQSLGSSPSSSPGVIGGGVGGAPAYSWLRRSMRDALSADAAREAAAWLSNARVDIEARFVPTFDALHDIQ